MERLVGHSPASVLAADLASKVPSRALIIVDAQIPPARGSARAIEGGFRDCVCSLADAGGRLPPWSDWRHSDRQRELIGIASLARDKDAFQEFLRGLPRMSVDWFNDPIQLEPWGYVPAGYIQPSAFYRQSADESRAPGWPVVRCEGTHIHPTLQTEDTAAAIATLCRRLNCIG